MAKYVIDSETLDGLGDAIRSVTGSSRKYTPEEMMREVRDILNATTFILVDKDGNEYPAVYVDSDTVITATPNDIRKGTTAITAEGVVTGEKVIPAYYTMEGFEMVPPGSAMKIAMFSNMCEFTKLQALVCAYNTSYEDSVATEKVSINGSVYNVGSTEELAKVAVDRDEQSIDLTLINENDTPVVIRFFTYKEVY